MADRCLRNAGGLAAPRRPGTARKGPGGVGLVPGVLRTVHRKRSGNATFELASWSSPSIQTEVAPYAEMVRETFTVNRLLRPDPDALSN